MAGDALNTTVVQSLAASLVSEALVIVPVRHHSPACAWHLARFLEQVRPSAVLIEGPRDFTDQIPWLVHPEARLPLAIYTYCVTSEPSAGDSARKAAFYPFCDYSPETVAMQSAVAANVPVRFMDLTFAEQSTFDTVDQEDEAHSLLQERRYEKSHYLQALAQELGCRDQEALWEHLFEIPATTRTWQEHLEAIVTYCHLARADADHASLEADGTLAREAEMAWHIQQALQQRTDGEGPVVAVMGGFHAVVMPALLNAPAGLRPAIKTPTIKDQATAVIRYSFEKLERLNGYSAGMTSPAWHQQVWEKTRLFSRLGREESQRVHQDAALQLLFDIADAIRLQTHHPLPVPALTGAFQHTLQLAQLRNRRSPAREDALDAIISCFVKGDMETEGTAILAVAHRLLTGNAIGKVPAGAQVPPLVRDFDYRVRRAKLKIDDSQPKRITLDIYRRSEHRITSRLLQGLLFLGIPFARHQAGPDFVRGTGLERLQDIWEYTFTAATEAALVEASLWGVTVEEAVSARFLDRLARLETQQERRSAAVAAGFLVQACVLGLHDHMGRIRLRLMEDIALDPAFDSLSAAVSSLALLLEAREPLEPDDLPEISQMLASAYERATYLGRCLPDASQQGEAWVDALLRLRELINSRVGHSLDESLYWGMITQLFESHPSPLLRGAVTGLLYAGDRLAEPALASALQGYLNGTLSPQEAGQYLKGLLSTAREVAWQQPALLACVNDCLTHWSDDIFLELLPELRLAFAQMTPRETDRIAEAVTTLHGERSVFNWAQTHTLSERALQDNLALSLRVRKTLQRDGLAGWFKEETA